MVNILNVNEVFRNGIKIKMDKITYQEIIKMIDRGEEFEILYQSHKFWISQTKENIILTPDGKPEESQYFKYLSEFEEKAKLGENLLSEVKDFIE